MPPHHTKYWVVVFQPISEAVEPLGYVPIDVKFAMLSPLILPPVLLLSDPFASSGIPTADSYRKPARSNPS